MAKIISFAWTSNALIAGRKTVTQRQWSAAYAARFKKDDIVEAWNKQKRFKGARKIATIQLTADPVYQPDIGIPDEDYEGEGFAFLEENPNLIPKAFKMQPGETMWDRFNLWRWGNGSSWVIRFKLISITDNTLNVDNEAKQYEQSRVV